MSSIHRLPSGRWRVQIRRGRQYVSRSFLRQADAKSWALDMERRADRGESLLVARPKHLKRFSDLIDLHIADMAEVGKPLRRSKAYSLELLSKRLGYVAIKDLDRVCLIDYGRERRQDGTAPA
ncbi:MAG: hypothetical protein AAFX09_00360 [Pseudomonadota bacterium]